MAESDGPIHESLASPAALSQEQDGPPGLAAYRRGGPCRGDDFGWDFVLPENRSLPNAGGLGPRHASEVARHSVAAQEAILDPNPRTDTEGAGLRLRVDLSRRRLRSLMEYGRKAHEPCGVQAVLPPVRSCEPASRIAAIDAFTLNRRIRNDMRGGVEGRRAHGPFLSCAAPHNSSSDTARRTSSMPTSLPTSNTMTTVPCWASPLPRTSNLLAI